MHRRDLLAGKGFLFLVGFLVHTISSYFIEKRDTPLFYCQNRLDSRLRLLILDAVHGILRGVLPALVSYRQHSDQGDEQERHYEQ